jgi:mRNA interferase RelE/StbE
MVYAVEFATAARRQFRKLPRAVQATLQPEIDALASESRPHSVEKMSGEENA